MRKSLSSLAAHLKVINRRMKAHLIWMLFQGMTNLFAGTMMYTHARVRNRMKQDSLEAEPSQIQLSTQMHPHPLIGRVIRKVARSCSACHMINLRAIKLGASIMKSSSKKATSSIREPKHRMRKTIAFKRARKTVCERVRKNHRTR